MRTLAVVLVLVGCQRSASPLGGLGNDPGDRESYSLGYQLGTSLKNQDTSIKLDVYVAGLRDALAGTPSQVSEQELQAAVKSLRDKAVNAQKRQQRETADKNKAAGVAFLEANKKREGVKSLADGLQYRVLADGNGPQPTNASTVRVSYKTSLIDGKELSHSTGMAVDLQRVIPAWKEAIPLMKEGSKWELVVPPELAYGTRGSTGIGPQSTLIFEVELLAANAAR